MPNRLTAKLLSQAPTDPVELDSLYNNRALVPEFADHLARWQRESDIARDSSRCLIDLPYGTGPNETLDVFMPSSTVNAAPVLVFIHGGYWRSLDKRDHSFVAPPFVAHGAVVIVINYALCPTVTVPDIALQSARALSWVFRNIGTYGGDPMRITVLGHSAGGHLAAMLLGCHWPTLDKDLPMHLVRRAISISGLFDLAPIQRTPFLQSHLDLTDDHVRLASPARWTAPRLAHRRGELFALVGGNESAEFLRQNALIQAAWGTKVVPVCEQLPGRNHFSALEASVEADHRLHELILGSLRD